MSRASGVNAVSTSPPKPSSSGVVPRAEGALMWASARAEDPWRLMVARSGPRLHLSEHI